MAFNRPQASRTLNDAILQTYTTYQHTPLTSAAPSKSTSRHLEEEDTEHSGAGSGAVNSWLQETQTDIHLGMVH